MGLKQLSRKKMRRLLASIIAVLVLAVFVFSTLFIAAAADHDCCGDGCCTCYAVHQCEMILAVFASVSFITIVKFVLSSVLIILMISVAVSLVRNTPVLAKVRLNN